MRRLTLLPVALAAMSLAATAFAPAASAATDPDVVAGGLVSPLSLAIGADGTAYVSQNFASVLTKAVPGEDPAPIFADEAQREVGAVSVSGTTVTFATTAMGGAPDARLWTLDAEGNQTEVADLWAYEKSQNPDGGIRYGILGLSKSCKHSIPKDMRHGVVAYKGIKDSHPYASYMAGDTTYVADAAANAILAVTADGVSTVAVLPPVKVKVTKKLRKGMGLPYCTHGKTFKGEPVPTDVELGPDGNLYVTTLGGALGENMPVGSVYQVVPGTGAVHRMAGGLMSPVGLAIDQAGTAYISLLFPGLIMKQPLGGEASVFAEVPFPGDVEATTTDVWATATDLANDGSTPPDGKVLHWSAD